MKIEHYDFGRIVIDGREFRKDVLIGVDKSIKKWWRKHGHEVCLEDVKDVLESDAELFILGTGYYGYVKLLAEVENEFNKRGIKIISDKTAKACEIFNNLCESKRLCAGFHLTC